MSRQIQERVNFGHGNSLRTTDNFCNVVARPHFPFLQHAKVESWSVMFYEQGRHTRLVQADADAVAGYARLRDFKYRITNAVAIANEYLEIGRATSELQSQ